MLSLQKIFPIIDKAKKEQEIREREPVYSRTYPAPQLPALAMDIQPDDSIQPAPSLPGPMPPAPVVPSPTFPVNQPMGSPAPLPAPMTADQVTALQVQPLQQPVMPAPPYDAPLSEQIGQPTATPLPGPSLALASGTPLSEQTAQKMHALETKDYSKAVYRRADGTETSHPTTNDAPNMLVKAAGADRKKNWSTGDKIRNGILGGLIGFAQGGIGGAVIGSAMSGSNRNYMSQMTDKKMLAGLRPQLKEQQQNEKFNAEQSLRAAQTKTIPLDDENRRLQIETQKQAAKDRMETQKQASVLKERNALLRQLQLTKRYKKGENPKYDAQLEAVGIDQPDFEPEKKVRPRFWDGDGKLLTLDENNAAIPVLTADGKEIVDATRGTVNYDGFNVRPGTALHSKSQVEASQVVATNQTNDGNEARQRQVAELNGKIATASARIESARSRLKNMESLTGLERIKSLDEKTKLENELTDATAEKRGYESTLNSLPKNAPTASRTMPVIGSYNESQFRGIMKSNGKTPEQIEILVKKGKEQGIVK